MEEMQRNTTACADSRWLKSVALLLLVGLGPGLAGSSGVVNAQSNRIACTESALLAAISQQMSTGVGRLRLIVVPSQFP